MNSLLFLLQISEASQAVVNTVNDAVAQAPVGKELSIWELTKAGGWTIMVPIGIMSVIAVYIIIERYLATKRAADVDPNFMNTIRDLMHEGKIDAAKELCKRTNTPMAKLTEKGVSRLGRPLPDINQAIETVGNLEVSKLEKNVAALATIAGAAPMLGFLGTVMGMVQVFFDMANSGNNLDINLLSNGMYQAMVTTIAGLIVGIIALIGYNVIVARIEKVVFILQMKTTEFMDLLHEPGK